MGLGCLVFGVLLLLPLFMSAFDFSFGQWWPLLLILMALSGLIRGPGKGNVVFLLVAVILLLNSLGVIDVPFWIVVPVGLIIVGLVMLFGGAHARKRASQAPEPGHDFDANASFSTKHERIDSKDWSGGHVSSRFGELHVDMTEAELAGGAATLHVDATFSGVKLRVPGHWAVDSRADANFGAVEDKRKNKSAPSATLTITGSVRFAGIEILD